MKMKTRAAVLSGKNKISIREFELPEITDDELLVKVISDSACLSTYKASVRGEDHKRVPNNISEHPVIIGHEFAGIIKQVGNNLKNRFKEGDRFVLQPAMGLESGYSAGYSYEYFGGDATYCIIPKIAIDLGCVLPYKGTYFANASLSEPMSCIIGAFHANYHTKQYIYKHDMGVSDLIKVEDVEKKGIKLVYLNAKNKDAVHELMDLSDGTGYDDVFVFAAVEQLIETADDVLANDGCLNFFSGPTDNKFKAKFNFYNVHYEGTHIVGTSGGSTEDMLEAIDLSQKGLINPSFMITHVGGLNAVPETIKNLPNIPGGKKLIYPHIEMELTAIEDFEKLGKNNEFYRKLAEICKKNNNIWCEEAEKFLLSSLENK
jgi:L-sorbose 1-phosphate reductase